MGTSHRQQPVKQRRRRACATACASCSALPDGYEVALGNGGTTALLGRRGLRPGARARAAPQLRRVLHQVRQGHAGGAPFLADPIVVEAEPGDAPDADLDDPACDVVAWAHNETSTGVMVPVHRPSATALVLDRRHLRRRRPAASTSAEADVYYFAPQKSFAADGGLWLALLSPAALERIARDRRVADRWIPDFLSLADRAGQLRQGPDLQHAGGRDAACCSPSSSTG